MIDSFTPYFATFVYIYLTPLVLPRDYTYVHSDTCTYIAYVHTRPVHLFLLGWYAFPMARLPIAFSSLTHAASAPAGFGGAGQSFVWVGCTIFVVLLMWTYIDQFGCFILHAMLLIWGWVGPGAAGRS